MVAVKKNKWWFLLVQGFLIVVLGYYLLSQSDKIITAFITIAGYTALFLGAFSILSYFLSNKTEKSRIILFTGIFSCVAGIFFLQGSAMSQELISWVFAAYMTFNVVMLVRKYWSYRAKINWWWLSILLLIYTFMILYFFITNTAILNIKISILAGIQFFANGVGFILGAFVERRLQRDVAKKQLVDPENRI